MTEPRKSKSRRINWIRILANTLYGIFSSLAGVITANAILKTDYSIKLFLLVALLVGVINGGLAFSVELKKEVEGNPKSKTFLSLLLLF